MKSTKIYLIVIIINLLKEVLILILILKVKINCFSKKNYLYKNDKNTFSKCKSKTKKGVLAQ
jgi:hypothetical protein